MELDDKYRPSCDRSSDWKRVGIFFGTLLCGWFLFASGCSLFTSYRTLSRAEQKLVVAGHASVAESQNLLRQSPAQRFVGRLAWPVKSGKIYSRFGARSGRFHAGIDIPAEEGYPIRAACTGRIEFAAENVREYGSTVVLRCGELVTLYAHADELEVDVGDEVIQGAQIATVGTTGNATGAHLHFETRIPVSGSLRSINPELFFP